MRVFGILWLWEWKEKNLRENYYEGKSIISSKWLAVEGKGDGRVQYDWGFNHND